MLYKGSDRALTNLVSGAWDSINFDSATDLTGIPDQTAALQGMIDLVGSDGWGGTIDLPPGVFRINGARIDYGGVNIVGSGWEEYEGAFGANAPAKRGKRGTYILTDDPAKSAFTFGPDANRSGLAAMAFVQPQPVEAPAWTPTTFAPSVAAEGPDGGAIFLEHLLFWGCFQPMQLGLVSNAGGRLTLRDIWYTSFANSAAGGGILVHDCDDVIVDNVNHSIKLLEGSPYQQDWIRANAYGLIVKDATRAVIANCSFDQLFTGLALQGTYTGYPSPVPRIKLSNLDFDYCAFAFRESGSAIAAQINGITCRGRAGSEQSYAIYSEGTNPTLDIDMLFASEFYDEAVQFVGSGAAATFGVNCWFDQFGLITGGAAAIAALTGNAVKRSNNSRLTNEHGGSFTSGAGTFTAY